MLLTSCVLLLLVKSIYAPVPRCSPFIIINKVPESSNYKNDFNPYFPVPPCEYGGPIQALMAGDLTSVSLLAAGADKIPKHNFYEAVWLLTRGPKKIRQFLSGEKKFVFDPRIIFEGYSHNRGTLRIGDNSHRDTSIIDNDERYWKGIQDLLAEGKRRRRK